MSRVTIFIAAACVACIEWTRISGTVRAIDLKDSTVTVQTHDGALFVVPVDYQVTIREKHGEIKGLKQLELDQKVTLTRLLSPQPQPDSDIPIPPVDKREP